MGFALTVTERTERIVPSDLEIRILGPCRYPSPLSHRLSLEAVSYVGHADRVLLDDRLSALQGQSSSDRPAFELAGPRNRVFLYGGIGTSFDDTPLPTDEFALGTPFNLGAYDTGELRGAEYYVATGGVLRQVGRLPDFMGGPIFAGAWLENGDAFDEWSLAGWRTNGGVGVIMDTLVGPVLLAGSWGFDGRWRTYIAVGRVFR